MKNARVAHAAVLPDVPEQRLTVVLALATLVSAFGSSFQYGYNVAVINPPEKVTMAKNRRSGRVSRLSSADVSVLSSCSSSTQPPTCSATAGPWRTPSSRCSGPSPSPCFRWGASSGL